MRGARVAGRSGWSKPYDCALLVYDSAGAHVSEVGADTKASEAVFLRSHLISAEMMSSSEIVFISILFPEATAVAWHKLVIS